MIWERAHHAYANRLYWTSGDFRIERWRVHRGYRSWRYAYHLHGPGGYVSEFATMDRAKAAAETLEKAA